MGHPQLAKILAAHPTPPSENHCREREVLLMGVYYTHGQQEKCDLMSCQKTIKWVNSNNQPANSSKYLNTQVLFVFQKEVKLPQQLAREAWVALFPI